MFRTIVVGAAILVAVAGVIAVVRIDSALQDTGVSASSASASSRATGLRYDLYAAGGVDRGNSALLFFAGNDPFSETSDEFLRKVYASGDGVKLSTFRVEFASSTGARLTHGVLVPNTFVLLDPNGTRVAAVIHPSEEELRILLRGNVPVPPKP